ncbi:MAG TPA: SDR family oxidoreductase [Acidimicrobiales bacterium]|nr:SDR family oxidoreductase [Acidimicrobiales bacterium]
MTVHALVTGGASGIGAATSRRLVADGMLVSVADRNEVGAKDVAGAIGVAALAVAMDVTVHESVVEAVEAAEAAFGPIDVLVNCAGGGDTVARFVDTDPASWVRDLDLNLGGVIACTHAVLSGMLVRRSGSIVNVSSEAGRVGMVAGATYAAAKAGVIGFTKAIALETARRGVRVNAVAPGPIDTPLLAGLASPFEAAVRQGMVDATAMRRMGSPEEVAAAISFLAGPEASFITGHTMAVSGGLSMW